MASKGINVIEYVDNMRALLVEQPQFYGLMVERQVQARLLPRLAGSRVRLEPELWPLLVFCLEGHEVAAPAFDEEQIQRALAAASGGTRLMGDGAAVYPAAAKSVAEALVVLREVGVYPRPVLG
jgi:hypothetical protein